MLYYIMYTCISITSSIHKLYIIICMNTCIYKAQIIRICVPILCICLYSHNNIYCDITICIYVYCSRVYENIVTGCY